MLMSRSTKRRLCEKCNLVGIGNWVVCPNCHHSLRDITGLLEFAHARRLCKPPSTKTIIRSRIKRVFMNTPIDVLWRMQVHTQRALVKAIIECDGDFEKQSTPELKEIRNDLYSMQQEFNIRRT